MVFDSGTNKWKKLVILQDEQFTNVRKNHVVFTNGALTSSFSRLLVFDLDSESWRKIHLPCQVDGQDDTKQNTADMTAFVQNLLQQRQSRFQTMSESIISKIDEMGNRIDELEQSINDLRTEMGQEGPRLLQHPQQRLC